MLAGVPPAPPHPHPHPPHRPRTRTRFRSKDFSIVNVQRESSEANTRLLLLGNLLSFFEQQAIFAADRDLPRSYNLAQPLWVFVGSSVNAVYVSSGRDHSDVLTVVRFFHTLLRNRSQWSVRSISRILEGRSGLTDAAGQDLFVDRFQFCGSRYGTSGRDVFNDVLASVFHASDSGGSHDPRP